MGERMREREDEYRRTDGSGKGLKRGRGRERRAREERNMLEGERSAAARAKGMEKGWRENEK